MIRTLAAAAFLLAATTPVHAQFWGQPQPEPSTKALMVQPLTDALISVHDLPWEFQTVLGFMDTTAEPVRVAFTPEGFTVTFSADDVVAIPTPADIPAITDPGLTAYGGNRNTAYGLTQAPDSHLYAGDVMTTTMTLVHSFGEASFSSMIYHRDAEDRLILSQPVGWNTNADLTLVNLETSAVTTMPIPYAEFPGLLERYDEHQGPGMVIAGIDRDTLLLREIHPDRTEDTTGPYYVFDMMTGVARLVDLPPADQ